MAGGAGDFLSKLEMSGAQQQCNNLSQQQQLMNMQMQQVMNAYQPQRVAPIVGQQNIVSLKKPKRSVMKLFKEYLEAHRDTIFTLGLLLLVDHYVFAGAFSAQIKAVFQKLLDKTHAKIEETK